MTKDELTENSIALAKSVAGKYTTAYYDYDELLYVAIHGLGVAALAYDESRGAKFSTYAIAVIHNEIRRFLKDLKRSVKHFSIDEPLKDKWENKKLSLADVVASEDDMVGELLKKETYLEIRRAVESLPEPRRTMMFLWMEGKTTKEIAKIYKITQPRVSQILIATRKKLKQKLGGCYV